MTSTEEYDQFEYSEFCFEESNDQRDITFEPTDDDTESEKQAEFWGKEELNKLKRFSESHPKLKRNDARGRSGREKLWKQLAVEMHERYSVEQLKLKFFDICGKWRTADVESLIQLFSENSILWDCSLDDYHNKIQKSILLKDFCLSIANRKNDKQAMEKFEGLKTTFTSIFKNKKGHTGDGGSQHVSWPFYESLKFLLKAPQQRETITNLVEIGGKGNDNDFHSVVQNLDAAQTPEGILPQSKSGTKRRHQRPDPDEMFKKKIMQSLEEAQTGADAFGASIASVLKKFSDVSQEYVKIQLQTVLAKCLKCELSGDLLPEFYSSSS